MNDKIETLFAAITDRIIGMLEQGVAPWSKPWVSADRHLPWNCVTGKQYTGMLNTFLLMIASNGFSSNAWCGMKQARDKGAFLKPGQKSPVSVIFPILKDDLKSGIKGRKCIVGFGARAIFNADQFDGLIVPAAEHTGTEYNPHDTAEAIIASMPEPPAFLHNGGGRAYYVPSSDSIHMPEVTAFTSMDAYYGTRFHEMMHSTGNEKRLGRKFGTTFGDHAYSQEELVAEMGSAYLMALAGIESQAEQTAAYVGSWLRALRNDRNMVYKAAIEANKGTRLIAGKFLAEAAKTAAA